jgi:hypothetical protein
MTLTVPSPRPSLTPSLSIADSATFFFDCPNTASLPPHPPNQTPTPSRRYTQRCRRHFLMTCLSLSLSLSLSLLPSFLPFLLLLNVCLLLQVYVDCGDMRSYKLSTDKLLLINISIAVFSLPERKTTPWLHRRCLTRNIIIH